MTGRRTTDLRDPRSFDHVGRDKGANQFVIGSVLADLADGDSRVVAATADLLYVTKLADFAERHPERTFEFGIAERNMLSAAAGLATVGYLPYVATFAAFAGILGYEAIKTDICYPGVPVRVLGTHAGISMGFFGTSHHATEDVAALRALAGLRILCPPDQPALRALLERTLNDPGPLYFRIGRGADRTVYPHGVPASYGDGRVSLLRDGDDVLLISTGVIVAEALEAAELIGRTGRATCSVMDAYQLKPFDREGLAALASRHRVVVVAEEHNVEGGLGSIVVEALADAGVGVPVYRHGLYDEFGIIGPPTQLYRYYGLDGTGLAAIAERAFDAARSGLPVRSWGLLWSESDRRAVLAEQHARDQERREPR